MTKKEEPLKEDKPLNFQYPSTNNYAKSLYTRSKIEKAGKVIASNKNIEDYKDYLPVVDNWRAAHAYPLDSIFSIVREALKERSDSPLLVSRLKRLDSIIGKLQREHNSGLYRMQDLGGCRIIAQNISDVYEITELLKKRLTECGHYIKENWGHDYIKEPRVNSGYRSIHLIVEFHSNDNDCYDGMFIEIQIRTVLQHRWATAVEIMDNVMNESLKAGTGNAQYMRFFKLVSALFSIRENTNNIAGISNNQQDIVYEMYEIDKATSIRQKLSAYNSAIQMVGDYPKPTDYYLLVTDMRKQTIRAFPFSKEDISAATDHYQSVETQKSTNGLDVVLVAASSFDIIRESYPNYFSETLSFLNTITELCKDYPEIPSVQLLPKRKNILVSDYFSFTPVKRTVASGYSVNLNGIGLSNGNTFYCPDWHICLDYSYLRYSGIILDQSLIDSNLIEPKKIDGPAIVAVSTGACFFIDKEEWSYVCNASSLVIQCKENVNKEFLLLLIGWLKSNLCTWNLIYNLNDNSIFNKSTAFALEMPDLEESDSCTVIYYVKTILDLESAFIREINSVPEENMNPLIEKFNNNILPTLCQIEKIYENYFSLSEESARIIKNELSRKGYFTYK